MTNKDYLVKINAQVADILRLWDGETDFTKWLNAEKKPLWKKGDVLIRRRDTDYVPMICRIEDISGEDYVVRFFTTKEDSKIRIYESANYDKVEKRSINDSWEDSLEKLNI